jgi:hypothetical protein
MTLKQFEIDWEGRKEIIEYEDDLTFGELEAILANAIDVSDITKPKVNIPEYRMAIMIKVLKKAPFKTGDAVAIRNLKSSIAKKVMKEVMKTFPLAKFLEDWVESFTGSVSETDSATISTTSVPPNLAGINE